MLLNENLFKEIPKRKLKEKHWEHKIDKDLAFRLRDILEDDYDTDYEALREVMKDIYDNIHRLIPDMFDEYECENAKEELDILDTEDSGYYGDEDEDEDPIDIEDSWNYELSNLYDICDTFNIWIPIRSLDECKDTEVQESYDKDGNHETCEECGALLTDAGECPRCVHGEEDLKEAFATKDMPGLIKAAKAAGLTTLSELDAFIKEHEGEDIMKALADKKKVNKKSIKESANEYIITYHKNTAGRDRRPETIDDVEDDWTEAPIRADSDLEALQRAIAIVKDYNIEDMTANGFDSEESCISYLNEVDWGDGSPIIIKVESSDKVLYDTGYDKQSWTDEYVDTKKSLAENTITNELPESIDQFLMDIAQTTNAFDYNDVSKFAKRATEEDIKKLKNLRRKWLRDAEMMEDDEVEAFGKKVASIIK